MAELVPEKDLNRFTHTDLDRIRQSTFVEEIEFHAAIDSTNNRALQLAREPGFKAPTLVLTEKQTAGRGRGANQWWAADGALTFSLVIKTESVGLPPRRLPQASLTVGLAVSEAIEDLLCGPAIQLKWPNDVYIQMRKVCGILVELTSTPNQAIVIGIGINVNNSIDQAPMELQPKVIALCDAAGRFFSLVEVLMQVLVRLQERLAWVGTRDDELRTRWRERCLLTNRTVHLDYGARSVVGLCRGIDDEGALLIETGNETERCFGGTITKF